MPPHEPTVHEGLLPQSSVAQVRALAEASERHDGVAALGEQTLLDLTDPGAAVMHVRVHGPDLVGYAAVDLATAGQGTVSAELVAHPQARRRGVGSALLGAVRTASAGAGARPLVWAHGNLPGARALAAHAGMSAERELWQMSLDLTGHHSKPPPVPDDVVVRPFVVGQDEQTWLAVNARAFAGHPEQGHLAAADLAAREREPWFRPDDLLLAQHAQDGRLLAFAWIKVEPGQDAGELYALGVDPDAQSRGLGRLLTALTVAHVAALGLRRAVLYTDASNVAAVRTYTAAGFRTSRTDVQYG